MLVSTSHLTAFRVYFCHNQDVCILHAMCVRFNNKHSMVTRMNE